MSIRDEMVRCPFDEHHRVSRARFPVHLIKCRKQHKDKNFSICPYNATHYILTPEFQFHLDNCPDKKERDLAVPLSDGEKKPSSRDIAVPPPSEIWGNDEEEVISYLEVKDKLIEKLPILRVPAGMTKAERKRFIRREVHRFHNLGKEEIPSTSRGFDNEFGPGQEERQVREEWGEQEEEQEEDRRDNDQAAWKKTAGKQAQDYKAEDEHRGAVGRKQEYGGQFSVVKKKNKNKNTPQWEAEDKGGKSSSDKKKYHGHKHH